MQENTGRVVDYTYDDLYRLTQESITGSSLGNLIITYSYDPVGNRLTKNDTVEGPRSYTYDENDRLLTENGTIYTYDNNGNTINKTEESDVTTYIYDYENRLIGAQTPTAKINYSYDTDGIRVSSTVNNVVTNYLVDKNRDYAQVLEERDAGFGLNASYVYGDDLISMDRSDFVSFYHYDGNGNTRQLTDMLENITDTYIYDAFGILLDRTGITKNNYLYSGEQYDGHVGFYCLRARYYNYLIGRFITLDNYQGNRFNPISLHKYLYTNVNPINNIDPSGNVSLGQQITANTIITILANIATAVWTIHTIGKAGAKIDGYILNVRGSGFIRGATYGIGLDVIYDTRSKDLWFSFAAEGGLDPLSLFKHHRKAGFSATIGVVFNMRHPIDMAGFGASAYWPISVMRLMPNIFNGPNSIWGMMTQFAKNVNQGKGGVIGFGRSFNGPAFIVIGLSARQFSSIISLNTDFVSITQMPNQMSKILRPIRDSILANLPKEDDYNKFCLSANKVLNSLGNIK